MMRGLMGQQNSCMILIEMHEVLIMCMCVCLLTCADMHVTVMYMYLAYACAIILPHLYLHVCAQDAGPESGTTGQV